MYLRVPYLAVDLVRATAHQVCLVERFVQAQTGVATVKFCPAEVQRAAEAGQVTIAGIPYLVIWGGGSLGGGQMNVPIPAVKISYRRSSGHIRTM